MKKLIDLTFKYWKWALGVNVIITLFFAYSFLDFRINNSLENLSIESDPDLFLFKEMEKEFGGSEFAVISFKGKDIFSPETLTMIHRMTYQIERIKNVEKVLSLTNAEIIKGTSDGFSLFPLIPEKALNEGIADALKTKVINSKMYKRLLVSDNGEATSIIAWMVPLGKDDAARVEVIDEIKKIVNEEGDGRRFYFYGMPVYLAEIFNASLEDQFIFSPVLLVLMGLLLFFFIRNMKLVILPFVIINICSIWAVGLLIFAGNPLNYITMIIPSILLIICMADSVHMIAHYKELRGNYSDKKEALRQVVIRIGIPILLTSLTTTIGFFSLGGNDIKHISDFGIIVGLGVMFAFVSSVTILPIILNLLKLKDWEPVEDKSYNFMEGLLSRIGEFVYKRKWLVLTLSGVITIISIVGISKVEARRDIVGVFKNQELLEAGKFIDSELGGSAEIDLLIDAKRENAILEPNNLRALERIETRITDELRQGDTRIVRNYFSIVKFLKEMNQAMNRDNPAYYRIPSTKEEAIDYLEICDKDQADIHSILNNDYSKARIRAIAISVNDSLVIRRDVINKSEKIILEETKGTDLDVVPSGFPVIWCNMMDYLIEGMMNSFLYAMAAIMIMMIIVFRSIKLGLISMIINIIPLIVTFGIMGWLNIPINDITLMVPSIAIGIAVDDTIHFFWRMTKEIKVDGNYKDAISRSLKSVGKPIITTSVLLCVGFSALYVSRLVPMSQFAFLTSLIVVIALIADLFLGPALLLVFKPIKVEKRDALVPEVALEEA